MLGGAVTFADEVALEMKLLKLGRRVDGTEAVGEMSGGERIGGRSFKLNRGDCDPGDGGAELVADDDDRTGGAGAPPPRAAALDSLRRNSTQS